MPTDVPIRCKCGEVRGVARGVSGQNGNRVVCYCNDCQYFAHFLALDVPATGAGARIESASEILDAHGGTDIFQMSPARLNITEGLDQLRCMRLTPKGLHRWYTGCCNTPVGNTLATRQIPFVGVIHRFMDPEAGGSSRDQALGPVRAGVNAKGARGDRAGLDAHDTAPPSMLFRLLRLWTAARLRGEHLPSPFFDAQTGQLSVTPRILTGDELRAVVAAHAALPG